MKLDAQTIPVQELAPSQIDQMLRLMQSHYEGVSEPQFHEDLRAKDWVILLSQNEQIRGFSTQVQFDSEFEGRLLKFVFSGDTIIEKAHWGSLALPIAWGRLMLSILHANAERDLYWLLTSKGYKTYRFLPVFFRSYYPNRCEDDSPLERGLLRHLASCQFGGRFNPATGILAAAPGAQRLREGIAEIDDQRLHDPDVAFFQKQNPGHARGDELVCLARFHPDNLTPYIARQLLE